MKSPIGVMVAHISEKYAVAKDRHDKVTYDEHRKNQIEAAVGSEHFQGTVIVNAKELQSSNARDMSHTKSAARRYCFYAKVATKYKQTETQENKCSEH